MKRSERNARLVKKTLEFCENLLRGSKIREARGPSRRILGYPCLWEDKEGRIIVRGVKTGPRSKPVRPKQVAHACPKLCNAILGADWTLFKPLSPLEQLAECSE